MYTTDYALNLFKEDIEKYNLPNLFDYDELLKMPFHERKSTISGMLYTFSYKMGISSDDDKKKLGHDISEILIECIFNNVKCTEDDFVWHFDKLYGKYLINFLFYLSYKYPLLVKFRK